jgi:hypothetical protein
MGYSCIADNLHTVHTVEIISTILTIFVRKASFCVDIITPFCVLFSCCLLHYKKAFFNSFWQINTTLKEVHMFYVKVLVLLYLQNMHLLYLAIYTVFLNIFQKKRSFDMSSKARISLYLFKIYLLLAVCFINVTYLLQYYMMKIKGKSV